MKFYRFGKRGEVEGDAGRAGTNDVIGPKDIQWLKYYLKSPLFSKRFETLPTDEQILEMISRSNSVTKNVDRNDVKEAADDDKQGEHGVAQRRKRPIPGERHGGHSVTGTISSPA